jgi:hypothetical protein
MTPITRLLLGVLVGFLAVPLPGLAQSPASNLSQLSGWLGRST